MDKLEYLAKTLSRAKRKDYENYVVNAVWNRLGRSDLKPVSQQWLAKPNGGGYFIDLYFPQLNIGIECDETYHLGQKEKDRQRELELIDILRGINDGIGYRSIHVDISKDYWEVERQINEAVTQIRCELDRRLLDGSLFPWRVDPSPEEYFVDRSEITVSDDIGFSTMREAYNVLFDAGYKGNLWNAGGTPRGPFKERYAAKYTVWFPVLTPPDGKSHAGWLNFTAEDGGAIYESNDEGIDESFNHEDYERVVFVKAKDPITGKRAYRFLGVFKMTGIKRQCGRTCREYVRQKTSFPILRRSDVITKAQGE